MCVAIFCPKDKRPPLETVKKCWAANPHGAGMAWRENGAVHWLKTNDVNELFHTAQKKDGEIVLHFRIASVGAVCKELRHPFPVSKRAGLASSGATRAVLFQNGTWHDWREDLDYAVKKGHRMPEGVMNDARAAAFLVSIYGHEILKEFGRSRWVYFANDETQLYGEWTEVDGMKFSNMCWQRKADWHKSTFADRDDADEDEDEDDRDTIPGPTPKTVTKLDRELNELWDMGGVEDYWEKLRRHGRTK